MTFIFMISAYRRRRRCCGSAGERPLSRHEQRRRCALHRIAPPLISISVKADGGTPPTDGDIALGYESHRWVAFHFETQLQDIREGQPAVEGEQTGNNPAPADWPSVT